METWLNTFSTSRNDETNRTKRKRKISMFHSKSIHFLYNKLPQTQWLKTTRIYYLTNLEVRKLKQISWSLEWRCWESYVLIIRLSGDSKEKSIPLTFPAASGHLHSLAPGPPPPPSRSEARYLQIFFWSLFPLPHLLLWPFCFILSFF